MIREIAAAIVRGALWALALALLIWSVLSLVPPPR